MRKETICMYDIRLNKECNIYTRDEILELYKNRKLNHITRIDVSCPRDILICENSIKKFESDSEFFIWDDALILVVE